MTDRNRPVLAALVAHSKSEPSTRRKGRAGWLLSDGRLRSGWRVALYLVAARVLDFVVGLVVALALVAAILARPGRPAQTPSDIASAVIAIVSNSFDYPALILGAQALRVMLVLALVWLFRRFMDRRSFQTLGFELTRSWWLEFAAGFGLIVVAWGIIFGLSLAFGAATVTGLSWNSGNWAAVVQSLAVGLALNVMVGIVEETDARGYVLQNLADGMRLWPAVIASSAYFALLHLLNPGAGFASTLGIFFAGILLAVGRVATGRLWFPIGMHAAWNFAEGPIFGFLVSGLHMGGIFDTHVTGPDWLMGGSFGPEAGALAVLVEITLVVFLIVWNKNRLRLRGVTEAG